MSAFTDDDLRILNGLIEKNTLAIINPRKKLKALLARLEAAEKVADLIANGMSPRHVLIQTGIAEWRAATGK